MANISQTDWNDSQVESLSPNKFIAFPQSLLINCAICIILCSISVRLIIFELANIIISIFVNISAEPVYLIILYLALWNHIVSKCITHYSFSLICYFIYLTDAHSSVYFSLTEFIYFFIKIYLNLRVVYEIINWQRSYSSPCLQW